MKKIYLILIITLAFTACKKGEQLSTDNGCITQIKRQNFNINAADSIAAVKLLQQNNLPHNNLVFERITLNDTITNTTGTHIYQHVFATQYFNGLPLISSNIGYHFRNGVFYSSSGTIYSSVNLDNHPSLSLPRIRKLYLNEVDKDIFYKTSANFKDSCLVAQLSYYDLNAGTSNSVPHFVKAWNVTPKGLPYPIGVFRDDNAQVIVYTNGIETLNQSPQ